MQLAPWTRPISYGHRAMYLGPAALLAGTRSSIIYANGVQVANSERVYIRENQDISIPCVCMAIATVGDSQAIDVRWRVSTGTGRMGNRCLTLLKVG